MKKKPKLIEVTVRVRVPADMSPKAARDQLADSWHGDVYARHVTARDPFGEVVLKPRWGKARLVPKRERAGR